MYLPQNLYYNSYYPNTQVPNYWVLGPSGIRVEGEGVPQHGGGFGGTLGMFWDYG